MSQHKLHVNELTYLYTLVRLRDSSLEVHDLKLVSSKMQKPFLQRNCRHISNQFCLVPITPISFMRQAEQSINIRGIQACTAKVTNSLSNSKGCKAPV